MEIRKDTPLKIILSLQEPCHCDKCRNGCMYGSGAMIKDDLKELAKLLKITEEELKKEHLEEIERFNTKLWRPKIKRIKNRPYGPCKFYDKEIGCRIHKAKPLECKIAMGCKPYGEQLIHWFTLNYFVNKNDPESIRQWAVFLKTQETIPGGELHELVPDRDKLHDILNYDILDSKNIFHGITKKDKKTDNGGK